MTPANRPDPEGADHGMDWLTLLLAGGGSAYGAFIPVYLTTNSWTQTRIGLVLTVGTIVGMLCQVPAGLLVDAIGPRRRTALYWAIAVSGLVPLVFVLLPRTLPVLLAMACRPPPAACSPPPSPPSASPSSAARVWATRRPQRALRLDRRGPRRGDHGRQRLPRLPESGVPGGGGADRAGAAGAASDRAGSGRARWGNRRAPGTGGRPGWFSPFGLLRDRTLLIYASCVALFQVASIAVIQLSAVDVTARLGARGALVIAAFLIVPQVVVALISPWLGQAADRFGHRTVLLAGFATVPIRGVLFALVRNPYVLVPVQVLEGAGGAAFGIMMPLIAADLTHGKGHYTLCLSLLGLAAGAGTAISTALAGWAADHYGRHAAFWVLAAVGVAAVVLVALAMPETRRSGDASAAPVTR